MNLGSLDLESPALPSELLCLVILTNVLIIFCRMKFSNLAESLLLAVLVVSSVTKAEVDSIEEVEKEPQVRSYI